jgi:hypothetical protein
MKRIIILLLLILPLVVGCKSVSKLSVKEKTEISVKTDSTAAQLHTEKTKTDISQNSKTVETVSKKDSSGTRKTVVDETFDPGTGKLTHRRIETEESAQRSEYNYNFNNLVELRCNYTTDIVDSLEIDFQKRVSEARDRESDYKSKTGMPFPWALLFWLVVGLGLSIWAILFVWKKGFRLW